MTASSLSYNVPLLATPFDSTTTNSTSPSPSQMANGFIASVDVVASATQNYLHNSSTSYVWLMQQLGLMMPFNPVAGASIVATKAGGIVSLRNSSTNATEFYVAKVDMAIGYTDPSLDPTHWQLINFNELSKYAAVPVTLASASTVNIGAALSGNVTISGTTTITAFDTIAAGAIRYVTYSGAVPITYNGTSMQLVGGISRTNSVGDVSTFQSLGSGNWKELDYQSVNGGIPAGTIISFAGTSAPNGYLVCPTAQTNISRTTYANLFASIGTTWGVGDGSTTFGMPWYPADYAEVQANSNVGTSSVGQVIAHTHSVPNPVLSGGGGSINPGGSICATTTTSGSTGGAANLAAGVRVLKCVKY